jgi:hypothetical protein
MQTQSTASSPPPPDPTAVLGLTITAFYPTGAIYPISYQLALLSGDPRIFTLQNGKLTVRVPIGTEVKIQYSLPDPRYVLLGAAFNPNGPGAGRQEFPTVTLKRDVNGSTMVVTDKSLPAFQGIDYTYVILVQQVATGFIGLIDPDLENDPP